jgi:hypothetical protein
MQRFDNHCSCHLRGEYTMVGRFWKPYMWQAVDEQFELLELIGGVEELPFNGR